VCISVANNRLFVGSIPKNKTRESILEDFGKVTGRSPDAVMAEPNGLVDPDHCFTFQGFTFLFVCAEGLQEVILYHQPDDKKKNRGFCFLEYEDHKSAAQARRRLMSGKVKVWGNPVTVEWADPVAEPDPEIMAKVSLSLSLSLSLSRSLSLCFSLAPFSLPFLCENVADLFISLSRSFSIFSSYKTSVGVQWVPSW